ncbi:MAG TPA: hypothetical protein VM327_08770 [Candidatus Thermoplasmatota archaeon]|nr:hypothetical protein [Candidatus Thermoplasmatota archaeon]
MHSTERTFPAPTSPNPIHILGGGGEHLVAVRKQALLEFHRGLDEADRNLRSLLPPKRPIESMEPVASAESPAFAFQMQAPWSAESADQPA